MISETKEVYESVVKAYIEGIPASAIEWFVDSIV